MKKTALFPGSFDPFTKGHKDIVLRGLNMFDKVIVALGINTKKSSRYFEAELIIKKIRETFREYGDRVEVITYSELTADLAKKHEATVILRGLRNTTDFEYENSIAQVNKYLNQELETVFLITSPEYAHISSTIIREVHFYKGDISEFIPYSLN
ncbi:MAG: pantetheine-phosphate adenylyltransferase [Cytophagales bacterium]|nr:pantetheine-phosphate adenylyltransferase [Cytophagales bacterium]